MFHGDADCVNVNGFAVIVRFSFRFVLTFIVYRNLYPA